MNTEQKLTKIREKCVELLAIAEKRTQGKWLSRMGRTSFSTEYFVMRDKDDVAICADCRNPETSESHKPNADFIAACAGPAEAGWRTTISAIDNALIVFDEILASEIIAAWEGLV